MLQKSKGTSHSIRTRCFLSFSGLSEVASGNPGKVPSPPSNPCRFLASSGISKVGFLALPL